MTATSIPKNRLLVIRHALDEAPVIRRIKSVMEILTMVDAGRKRNCLTIPNYAARQLDSWLLTKRNGQQVSVVILDMGT